MSKNRGPDPAFASPRKMGIMPVSFFVDWGVLFESRRRPRAAILRAYFAANAVAGFTRNNVNRSRIDFSRRVNVLCKICSTGPNFAKSAKA